MDNANFLLKAQTTGQDAPMDGIGSGNLRPLVLYLPQYSNKSILITIRSKHVAIKLV
ncbi:hypothetical protein BDZ45DRAFT_680472, partial [Acephala macrosclerotiorum]